MLLLCVLQLQHLGYVHVSLHSLNVDIAACDQQPVKLIFRADLVVELPCQLLLHSQLDKGCPSYPPSCSACTVVRVIGLALSEPRDLRLRI